MPSLVLAAKSTADRDNRNPSAERLVNCYAYPAPEGAKAPLIIRASAGLRDHSSVPGPFLRAMERINDELYIVSAGALWKITEAGTAVMLASVTDDPNTSLAGHRDNVTIAAGGAYAVWNGTAITEPGSGALAEVSSVAFLSQYTLMGELGAARVEWTEVGDPLDRNALYFATAEARDDKIVRIMSYGAYLMVMKETSVETWGTTGLGGSSAFIRIGGEVIERGLKSYNLACWTPEGLFWVGTDDMARLNASIVSPPNVTLAIGAGEPTHCFYYEDRGHKLAVIRFEDRPAWVYDITMEYWHERAEGVAHRPWDAIDAAYCYGQWHIGDRHGRVYRLGVQPHDVGAVMRRTITSRNLFIGNADFSVGLLELEGRFGAYDIEETAPNWLTTESGFPLTTEDGQPIILEDQGPIETHRRPGRIEARFSRDGGHTFGLPKQRDIGKTGDYTARCRFHALGQFSDMVVELSMTDPVDTPLLSEANVAVS
jgi:hypothetical protein